MKAPKLPVTNHQSRSAPPEVMADSSDRQQAHPHIALLPSSGMGHLVPFVRLAATLAAHDCQVTFITTHPTVSLAESSLVARLLSAFPHAVTPKGFHILPLDPSTANSKDPFFLQFEAIRRSAHLLSHLLNSSSHSGHPPLSALVTDVTLASAVIPVTHDLHIPNYVLFTSSAKMLSLLAYFPALVGVTHSDEINIPGIPPLHKTWLPPPLLDQTNLFTTQFTENGEALVRSDGILINTFKSLEPETVAALNEGKVINGLPPVIPVGPLVPCECETERGGSSLMEWLDGQEKGSVVYVSFGSRTAMSREQIREVGEGLVRSGCGFVWVVKDKKVDREEEGVEEVVGRGLMERIVKDRKGVVLNKWVDQEAILSLEAVGGFVSHCGWNSVMEAAWHGVRLLAWPQGGDQRINAEVVERSGLGVWVRSWQWGGGGVNVKAEEIDERVREMMGNERLRVTAAQVRDEARKAAELGGASHSGLRGLSERLLHTIN